MSKILNPKVYKFIKMKNWKKKNRTIKMEKEKYIIRIKKLNLRKDKIEKG